MFFECLMVLKLYKNADLQHSNLEIKYYLIKKYLDKSSDELKIWGQPFIRFLFFVNVGKKKKLIFTIEKPPDS